MKLFGIGLSGYIGEAVSARLLADGHTLTGLARSERAATALRERGVEPVMGSMADVDVIREAVKQADGALLMSTGGFLSEAVGKGPQYINCIEAILSALEGTGKPFMQLGGTGAWLGIPAENPGIVLDESIPYSTTTFYAEMLPGYTMVEQSEERGVRGFCIIPGQVYGRDGGYIGPIARRFEDFRKNGAIHFPLGSKMENMLSFTHVDDLAYAVALGFERAKAGERYIVVTDNENLVNISRMVSRICGLGGRLVAVDKKEMEEKTSWTGVFDFGQDLVATASKLRRELGWEPRGLCVIDELQRLMDSGADKDNIYPMTSRQETLKNIKL